MLECQVRSHIQQVRSGLEDHGLNIGEIGHLGLLPEPVYPGPITACLTADQIPMELDSRNRLVKPTFWRQEVQVAHGPEADAGVEGGGQVGALQKDDRDWILDIGYWVLERGAEGGEDAGEFALDEEVDSGGGVVCLAQVSLHPRTSAPLLLEGVVEQGGYALSSGGGGQQSPALGTKG